MRTLHVISHTHWDREWHQTFQQFRLKLVQLVDGLLDILEHDPDFKYFMLDGQTIVLDDYLLMRPEKEQVLRKHIQSGRILIGPWHILPDMFLVGPESHIRNLLEGERTAGKFGPKMMVGYMPDSFGHIGQMPQILRGFKIDTACLWRGLDEEPTEFWWQAPDGSRVLMAYMRDSYSNGASLPNGENFPNENLPHFAEAIAERSESLAGHSAGSDLLIMLGTDHMQPPRNTSKNIAYANKNIQNTRVLHSTLPKYLSTIQETIDVNAIPVVEGELRNCKRMHLLPGVLSTRIWIKQRNSASENLLTRWAEPFSTFAEIVQSETPPGRTNSARLKQPATILRQTWRLLMENHPHDSICGCSIDQVHDEMKVRFDQVDQIGEELSRQSLESLSQSIQTRNSNTDQLAAILVFNPLPYPRADVVGVDISLPPDISSFEIVDDQGDSLVYETLGTGSQELINTNMSPKEFRSALSMVNEGRVTGLGICDLDIQRNGSSIQIDIILHSGEPNAAVWQSALSETMLLLDDPGVTSFHVRARTADVTKTIFTAPQIPGLGWRTFSLKARRSENAPFQLSRVARAVLPLVGRIANSPVGQALIERLQTAPAKSSHRIIENEFFRVEVEPEGTLRVLDKRNQTLYSGLNRFVDGGDCGDEYNYSPPAVNPQIVARLHETFVHLGAVQQTLTINLTLKTPASLSVDRKSRSRENIDTPVQTTVTLGRGIPRIDIHTRVENRAKDHRLRVHFPTPFQVEMANYDGHFEIPTRKTGIPVYDRQTWVEDPRPELPQRAFTEISEEKRGLTLANRGLPEVEVLKTANGAEIALTLLRCVGWLSRDDFQTRRGHAGPGLETPGAQLPGSWDFDYSIIPHLGQNQVIPAQQAYAFETPLRAISSELHDGELPATGSFITIEGCETTQNEAVSEFTLSAIKQAENASGWLVRGYNPGRRTLQIKLTPFKRFRSAARVNLAEEKIADLVIDQVNGSVSLEVHSQEIVSIWFGS